MEPPEQTNKHAVMVVAVDLSELSEHLLKTATSLVRFADDAEINVVHVVPTQRTAFWFDQPIAADEAEARPLVEQAQFELGLLCEGVAEHHSWHVELHTPVGDPTHEIVRIAEEKHADAIVLEAHDRTGLAGFLHRSVAASVARLAPCSVVTVRGGAAEVQARLSSGPPAT
jgi:nucleotide-binding universal stress UspA family protein